MGSFFVFDKSEYKYLSKPARMNSTFSYTTRCRTIPNGYFDNHSLFFGQHSLSKWSYFTPISQNSFGNNIICGFTMYNAGHHGQMQQLNQLTNIYMLKMDSKSDEIEDHPYNGTVAILHFVVIKQLS